MMASKLQLELGFRVSYIPSPHAPPNYAPHPAPYYEVPQLTLMCPSPVLLGSAAFVAQPGTFTCRRVRSDSVASIHVRLRHAIRIFIERDNLRLHPSVRYKQPSFGAIDNLHPRAQPFAAQPWHNTTQYYWRSHPL